jgi:hypothetical protein
MLRRRVDNHVKATEYGNGADGSIGSGTLQYSAALSIGTASMVPAANPFSSAALAMLLLACGWLRTRRRAGAPLLERNVPPVMAKYSRPWGFAGRHKGSPSVSIVELADPRVSTLPYPIKRGDPSRTASRIAYKEDRIKFYPTAHLRSQRSVAWRALCPAPGRRAPRALARAGERWDAPNVLSVRHWERLLGGALYAGAPRVGWAAPLRRSFDVDLMACATCGSRLRVLALITEREAVGNILSHPSMPTDAPPLARARDPTYDLDDVGKKASGERSRHRSLPGPIGGLEGEGARQASRGRLQVSHVDPCGGLRRRSKLATLAALGW